MGKADVCFKGRGLPSAALAGGGASGSPAVEAVRLADGRRGLGLPEVALAASTPLCESTHHAGLNLLQVVCLRPLFGLQQVNVGLVPTLLLRGTDDQIKYTFDQTK